MSGPIRLRELKVTYEPTEITAEVYIRNPRDAIDCVRLRLEAEPVEVTLVLLLNTKNRVIGVHELGRGSISACVSHPRDICKVALLSNAAAVIVSHNHPSGDPSPSPDDIALLTRTRQATELLGLSTLDFTIIGHDGRYYSAKEAGLL